MDLYKLSFTDAGALRSSQLMCWAPLNRPDVAEKARQVIDGERATVLETLRRLNSRRNSLAPVSRLAPELLAHIFMLNTQFDYPHSGLAFQVAPSLKSCSHVCQYWRSVALAYPDLWNRSLNFHMETPEWTYEILRRSNPMPLDVRADSAGDNPIVIYNVNLALDHVPRIRVLNIWVSTFVMGKLVAKLDKSASFLQELTLHNSTDSNIFDLPRSLFASHTPRLRRLELSNCNIRWDSPMLQGLTHLRLCRMSPSARPSFSTLFGVLSQMPMLETLSLSHVLPKSADYDDVDPIIHFPKLTQLRLEGGVYDCAVVLNQLAFPSNVVLHLNCWAHSPQSNYSNVLALISTKFDDNLLQRVHVHCTAQEISIQGWITFDDEFDFDDYFARHMSICFYWSWDIKDDEIDVIPQLMCATFSTLCLTRLWRLSVFVDQSQIIVPDTAWNNMFSHASMVQHLRIRDPMNGPFFALVREKHPKEAERVFLPSLRRLLIEDADFAKFATRESKCGLLLEWLHRRRNMNAEIEAVQIRSCGHIGQETVEMLRSAVQTVNWDGADREAFFDEGRDYIHRGGEWLDEIEQEAANGLTSNLEETYESQI